MKRRHAAAVIVLACTVATPAFARHHKTHAHPKNVVGEIHCNRFGCAPVSPASRRAAARLVPRTLATRTLATRTLATRTAVARGGDPRPRAWCGWWMRHHLGVDDRAYNLARNWARYGTPAGGPAIGTIVVWRGHVGIITGKTETGWVVKSGNDDHAVRERERSLRGVIAYRIPNGIASR